MSYLKRTNPYLNDPDRIPCAVVAPVLEYAFSQWRVFRYSHNQFGVSCMEPTSGHHIACDLLSKEFGGNTETWAKRLNQILGLHMETCSLNVVDHFLVILGQHQLWYVPPLSDYYFSEQVLNAA